MTSILNRIALPRVAGAALAAGLLAAPIAEARVFTDVDIVVDLKEQSFDAFLYTPGSDRLELTSPKEVKDGVFTLIDIRLILRDDVIAQELKKTIDEGFEPEVAPCNSAAIGAMAMEDGVRYSFKLGEGDQAVTATLFTGSRSTHWANDFFCQYDEAAGADGAAMRVVGFYYVIHRPLEEGVDIQLRPVVPTPQEVDAYLNLKQQRRDAEARAAARQ